MSHCDINSVGYGIRCIQNARVSHVTLRHQQLWVWHTVHPERQGKSCHTATSTVWGMAYGAFRTPGYVELHILFELDLARFACF